MTWAQVAACRYSVRAVVIFHAVLTGGLMGAVCAGDHVPSLKTGVAVKNITPPVPYRMSGYFSERLSTGTHDPLLAKAIVFRQGDCQAALVFCDIIGIFREVSDRARELAERRTGIPAANIAVIATHSHTGPLYDGALCDHFRNRAIALDGKDPLDGLNYGDFLVEQIVEAISLAHDGMAKVTVETGITQQAGLSFNRRFFMKKGPVRFNPGVLNPNIAHAAGPIDPDVDIVLFRDTVGNSARASLVVFALHLDTTGGTLYSADYPGYLSCGLQATMGSNFVSLFGSGTCGDINHIDVTRRERNRPEVIGRTLAATVNAKLTDLRPSEVALAVRRGLVCVPLQEFSDADMAWAMTQMDRVADSSVPFLQRVKAYKIMAVQRRQSETLPIEVQVFRLGPETAIVTLPGEVFVDLGLAVKKGSPFRQTVVIELANDAPGYIPTRKAFAEGSYETVNSRILPGGGEKMVDLALQLLRALRE